MSIIKLSSFLYQKLLVYNNNTLANFNTTSSFIDNETSPYISEENENEGYLYLLILDLLIFSSLTYQTYKMAQTLEKNNINTYGNNTINNISNSNNTFFFAKWLVIANALRTLSLIFIILISNPNGNNGISWMNSILHVVPAFVFVTSYVHLSHFLSEIYTHFSGYQNLLIEPFLTLLINGCYAFLALIALITLLAKAYKTFFYISELLMALLYLVLGVTIMYNGKNASDSYNENLKEKNYENYKNKNNYGITGISLGVLFILKGICGLLEGIGVYSPPNHNVFDFFWFLILEVLPTVIVLYLSNIINKYETARSTINEENEEELASQRSTSYKPPFEN